jgi:ketosteroid isomerase-like protein
VRAIRAAGELVMVEFEAATITTDGRLHRANHRWILQLREGRIVRALAFADTAHSLAS